METLLLFILAIIVTQSTACDQPTKHYTTMGCIPSEKTNDKGCPLSYDCRALDDRQKDKCYLLGKVYAVGEQVPKGETGPACNILHTCVNDGQQRAHFVYAIVDCIEFFERPGKTCVLQYQTNNCCSTSRVCEPDIEQLATCHVDGNMYYVGQRMHLQRNPCQTCICSADFDENSTDCDEKCYEEKCLFEVNWLDALIKGAAPIYQDGVCCPDSWRIPEENDQLVKGPNKSKGHNLECKYGNLTLKVGDSVRDSSGVERCVCQIPPMVHCRWT